MSATNELEMQDVISEALEMSYGQSHAAETIAERLDAAGYTKPRVITTEEELDELPVGSVVLSMVYVRQQGWPVAFQRWDSGDWHRGGRSSFTHPDNFLPATVLWEPKP